MEQEEGSAILTVLTLYLRLHLKRQLHYLRLGMLALFTLTGDLEDAMSALVWPLLCLCARHLPVAGCNRRSDMVWFWLALCTATSIVAVLSTIIVVAIPEALAEIVRLSCMDGLVAIPV